MKNFVTILILVFAMVPMCFFVVLRCARRWAGNVLEDLGAWSDGK